ncbi:insulinase family protein [Patescibacteria group bacterium]|nr:insulinase family protein [Patescibacteria group bacterium]MBU1074664.1 insulinase family protein [Patescibacteria group bacterium]MBU1952036.1 insulinase family protein [Patescibacteria group bacterium]MBU2229618.1 insulinase family protein [Patescibacteria group bacterium]
MKYQKKTFSNGMKGIVAPLKETKTITLLVLVKVGSRYENANVNGVSHFIEHMMFKGTKRRPTTLEISKELDGIGAEFNAFTGKDHTGYYIKANFEKTELVFDILSDALINSQFDLTELNRERKVIEEEINMYRDNPQMHIGSLFEELVYGEKSFLGQQISGPKSVIRNVTRQQMMQFKRSFYKPKNTLVVVAGNISPTKGFNLIQNYFKFPKEAKKVPVFKKSVTKQTCPQIKLEFRKTEQAQLCIGFPAYSYFHKDVDALALLNIILGGNMSSRLFINIRERQGLCYLVRSSANIYEDVGNMVVQAGLDRKRVKQATRAILKVVQDVKQNGVTDEELTKSKDFLRGKLTIEMEDSESIAGWYGAQQLLKNQTLTIEEKFKSIQKVTLNDIKRVANDIFKTQLINLVIIGPFSKSSEFTPLLKV